jgi:hypothetical protein
MFEPVLALADADVWLAAAVVLLLLELLPHAARSSAAASVGVIGA